MINFEKQVQFVYDYFHPDLRQDVEDVEKDYLTKVSALLHFCAEVENKFESIKNEHDAYEVFSEVAEKAREFLAEEGR